MSIEVKQKIKEVADDFAMPAKKLIEIVGKFYEKPKSSSQNLTEDQLNVIFDYITQQNQIDSIEQVFAAAAAKKEAPAPAPAPAPAAPAAPAAQNKPAAPAQSNQPRPQQQNQQPRPQQNNVQRPAQPQNNQNNQNAQRPQQPNAQQQPKQPQPERKRERRVIDTSAVTVNADRYDDRVDSLVSDRVQNYQSGKQKIGNKNKKQQQAKRFGTKSRSEEQEKMRRLQLEIAKKAQLVVKIPDEITVGELAARLKQQAGKVIAKFMQMGEMHAINDVIDFDTASLLAEEFHAKVEKEVHVTIEERLFTQEEDAQEDLVERPPVVCVMGHVDHGKTSILDAIRKTNVTAGEAGGITQAIGAYQVKVNDSLITFLDTPGHEAFTSMRARGANMTDIAVLVVAADDGIMPQTVESINHAKAANVKLIVAMNKMDKPTANPERVMEGLTKYGIITEDWGGDVACIPVSALTGMGINDLLERIALEAEVMELKANPNRRAKGAVVEARLDKGQGPIATILVQNGTLHAGDVIIAGTAVGRVRTMRSDKGQLLNDAGPSTPVEITGLTAVPEAGDLFEAVADERLARELAEQRIAAAKEKQFSAFQKVTLDNLFSQMAQNDMKELAIVVKADVQGSAEAVKQSLEKISNDEVRVRVIHAGVGAISKSDVDLADASNAIIIGFNVRPDNVAKEEAAATKVEMRMYRVIYDAINDVTDAMKGMLAPKFREVSLGELQVRQVYKISNVGTVAGCRVTSGKITRDSQVRVVRDGIVIAEDEIASLKRFKDDAKEVAEGYECGVTLEKFADVKEGDVYEAFKMEEYRD